VAGLLWNQWQLSCGTGGSFGVEYVDDVFTLDNPVEDAEEDEEE
jgi:hypothetical protein